MNSERILARFARDLIGSESPILKTRAELKRELNETLASGEEVDFLNGVEKQLDHFHNQLTELNATRATIMRQISVRERKLSDWKGKIPRTGDVNLREAQRELQRVGRMPCTRIARFRNAREIVVEKALYNALQGVEGFSKLWLLLLAPTGLRFHASCTDNDLCLCLVHVHVCDAKSGVLTIDPMQFEGDSNKLDQVSILDMKPYLSYCEAWTERQREEHEGLDEAKPP
eukprot:TRINITY_DN766_c0_g1_i1.p2 TRINITY_DN766_c0_g1~~TRINITY_DN766_c0_g1_i1.p2  ORF type:complete len:229 (-),score=35.58 TRINITY_DN766_c0_g1_i1:4531-5217(-)